MSGSGMSIRDGGGDRESVRQCFLFSNHLIITTRTQSGKLHLVDNIGKIPLADVTLIEDPHEEVRGRSSILKSLREKFNLIFNFINPINGRETSRTHPV